MATLRNVSNDLEVHLRARSMVGRTRRAHVLSDSRRTSGEHALITFSEDLGWTVRDLGSRNGTTVDGELIEVGVRTPLEIGSRMCFGDGDDAWELATAGAPVALATDGTVWVEGEADLLGIPSLEDPELLVERTARGWLVGDQPVEDLHTLEVGGRTWTLHLSEELPATAEAGRITLDQCSVRFAVSSDEEFIQVFARLPDGEVEIPSRAHHELLLMMARRRLEDAQDEELAEVEHGWMYSAEVQKALRASANQIYVSIHRLRKEFAELGVVDGHDIIERRRTTRQVRIAVGDLTVQPLT